MGSQNIKTKIKQLKTKNSAMRVKAPTPIYFILNPKGRTTNLSQLKSQDKQKIKNKTKTPSSGGGARHRRHPFGRHALAEEDDQIKVEETRFGFRFIYQI
jgi:hypothetical protein